MCCSARCTLNTLAPPQRRWHGASPWQHTDEVRPVIPDSAEPAGGSWGGEASGCRYGDSEMERDAPVRVEWAAVAMETHNACHPMLSEGRRRRRREQWYSSSLMCCIWLLQNKVREKPQHTHTQISQLIDDQLITSVVCSVKEPQSVVKTFYMRKKKKTQIFVFSNVWVEEENKQTAREKGHIYINL